MRFKITATLSTTTLGISISKVGHPMRRAEPNNEQLQTENLNEKGG